MYFKFSPEEVCGAACGVTLGAVVGGEYVCEGTATLGAVGVLSTCKKVPIITIIAATKATVKITPNLSTPAMFMIFTGILNI
jgi:hypothetical protein